jgi:hypothetical protein
MGDINVELGRSRTAANTRLAGGSTPAAGSLFALANSSVNKVAPHRISEFHGYDNTVYYMISNGGNASGSTSASACSGTIGGFALFTTNANGIINLEDILYVLTLSGYVPYTGAAFISYNALSESNVRKVLQIVGNGIVVSKNDCTSYTQVFGWYTGPCGPQITIYQGSNGLYYSNTSGTIFNGTVYIPIGFNDMWSYDWSEQLIVNGNFEDNFIIQSGCTPS